ncbi:NADH:flavin oxidoreductase/NADH oxidase [Trametes meyenii]|nr:NADH:flavin oxidoreductase/NADH oxidase [Trametes meyenii]
MKVPQDLPAALFKPIQVGDIVVGHRIVHAPLTRCRADKNHTHTDIAITYHSQRASTPGTLLIAEATFIAPHAGLFAHVPGIYNDEQIVAWKKVVDAVHERGSYIFLQLWALGRAAQLHELQEANPEYPYVSASALPLSDREDDVPRALTVPEIKQYAEDYAKAAHNAVHGAGLDGVEIHCAHGYLIDQFLQDVSNKRTDEYGGSIENRCRFALEVIDAVVRAVGQKKAAFRISPWSSYQDMRMADPVPTFTYLVSQVAKLYPQMAYLSVVEPGVHGATVVDLVDPGESNDFIRNIWSPRPLISAGRYTRETAMKRVEENAGELIAFGRLFLANPDLPLRLFKGLPLNCWDRAVYATPEDPHGYIDYPFIDESYDEHTPFPSRRYEEPERS